jgi:hypothetical protein
MSVGSAAHAALRSFCTALLLLLATLPAARCQAAAEMQDVNRIEWVGGARNEFPAADALWQSHTLPLRWSSSSGTRYGVWLRYSFDLSAAPADGWSILLDRLAHRRFSLSQQADGG